MRIGIICKGENTSRRGFEISKIGNFGTAEIYMAEFGQNGGKRRFTRRLKRCAAHFLEMGIFMCAVERGFEDISRFGISCISDEFRVFRENAGEAALLFSHAHGINADFLIIGGSFSNVTEAAKTILRSRRYIYIKNPAFDEISAEIEEESGVVAREDTPEGCVKLYMCDEKIFISYGAREARFSDFRIKLPGELSKNLPNSVSAQVAALLQMNGVLRKREVKVEYLPK